MPLDRRITLRVASSGTRNEFDEYVPGALHEYGLWALVSDTGATDDEEEVGTRVEQRRTFTIRWRRDAIDAGPSRVSIVDEYGRIYEAENITEDTDPMRRRRFLDITAKASD